MSNELPFDPFTTEGLLAFTELDQKSFQSWHGFNIDTGLKATLLELADPIDVPLDPLRTDCLKLSLDEITLSDIDISVSSSPAPVEEQNTSGDQSRQDATEHDDIWRHQDIHKHRQDIELLSWDTFLHTGHKSATSTYLSEAGPRAFDAVLRKEQGSTQDVEVLKYAKPDILLRALRDVALGRESAFFRWDSASSTFVPVETAFTVSGVSQHLLDQTVQTFLPRGAKYRSLSTFQSTKACRGPYATAFASAVQDVLGSIERVVEEKLDALPTLLRLQDIFEKPFGVVDVLFRLMGALKDGTDTKSTVQKLFNSVEENVILDADMEVIQGQLISRTLQPGLEAIGVKLGLSTNEAPSQDSIVNAIKDDLPRRTANVIESANAALQLLRSAAPQKLSALSLFSPNKLEFCLTWDDIGRQQKQAERYEQMRSSSLTESESHGVDVCAELPAEVSHPDQVNQSEFDEAFDFKFDLFDKHALGMPPQMNGRGNSLGDTTYSALTSTSSTSSLTRLSLAQSMELTLLPMLAAQHRLLSYMAYQSMFHDNHLITHLQIMYRFHLMNDGLFTSRLSLSLFSSEEARSTERGQTNITTGLRLQSRDTWPPASSELRLVLMGILSESMSDIRNEDVTEATSFAIRDLPDEELEQCRNINSIYALDFLCLRYKAPSPLLESVITAKALKRYDRTFMYLLRMLRVKDLAQYLLRRTCTRGSSQPYSPAERKLCRDMNHFTTALANYSHSIAISTHWHRFETKMRAIQNHLIQKDYHATLELASSLDHLRSMHEQTLNDISQALLLRKRQREAHGLIEDIFSIILQYAAGDSTIHKHNNEDSTARTQVVTSLRRKFDSKLRSLLDYLTTVSSQALEMKDESEMAQQLLLALDYAGYYSKKRNR